MLRSLVAAAATVPLALALTVTSAQAVSVAAELDGSTFSCPDAPRGDPAYRAFLKDGSGKLGLGRLCSDAVGRAQSSAAAQAVACAATQVGDPYVPTPPGATPPGSWDSSKLTAYCWNAAVPGLGLIAYSYSQFDQVKVIKPSQVRPGDLLFFFKGGTHHVGMAINSKYMIEAGNQKDGVVISSWKKGWAKDHLTAVGRVKIPAREISVIP